MSRATQLVTILSDGWHENIQKETQHVHRRHFKKGKKNLILLKRFCTNKKDTKQN